VKFLFDENISTALPVFEQDPSVAIIELP